MPTLARLCCTDTERCRESSYSSRMEAMAQRGPSAARSADPRHVRMRGGAGPAGGAAPCSQWRWRWGRGFASAVLLSLMFPETGNSAQRPPLLLPAAGTKRHKKGPTRINKASIFVCQ